MNNPVKIIPLACVMLAAMSCIAARPAQAQSADTSFFVTSNGVGNGGNLGGLAGADNQCQTLAQAAGAGGKPGAPISRPRPPMASLQSMPAIASATDRGKMPRAS